MTGDAGQLKWFIEWTYSPAGFFEEPIQIAHEHCELSIRTGKIIAKIDPAYGDPRPTLQDQLHAELINRFVGTQLVSAKPFKLSPASIYNEKPGGGRNVFITVESIVATASVCADIQIRGKDGTVIWDPRRERIKQMRSLGDLAAKHGSTDRVASKILQSYRNAIDDPDNSLVHLYEIADALAKHFGTVEEAKRKLNIRREWKCLGKLANDEPLRQGRHRGRMLPGLRDATKAELDAALSAARNMIESYLRHIDDPAQQ